MSSGLLWLARVGPAIAVLSTRRCVPVTECCEVPSSFILSVYPFPLLCFSVLLAPLVFRTRPVGFFPQVPVGWVSAFRCCASAVRFDPSWTFSSTLYTLDDSNVWIVFVSWTNHHAMGTSLRRLDTFVTLSQSLRLVALLC